jgi:hypothetical protein
MVNKFSKKHLILIAVGALLCVLCGIWIGKGMYDRPLDESVSRNTVILHDTVPDIAPEPKDSVRTRWVTRWLPMKPDTVSRNGEIFPEFPQISANFSVTDTVAVQVPITSKHYSGKNYDAYVSGFEPRLDSIFVYNETQIITETITRMKPPNKLSLSVNAGVDYGITSQFWQPYANGELTLNNHKRLQLGIEGGVKKNEVTKDFEPYAGAKLKIKVF